MCTSRSWRNKTNHNLSRNNTNNAIVIWTCNGVTLFSDAKQDEKRKCACESGWTFEKTLVALLTPHTAKYSISMAPVDGLSVCYARKRRFRLNRVVAFQDHSTRWSREGISSRVLRGVFSLSITRLNTTGPQCAIGHIGWVWGAPLS